MEYDDRKYGKTKDPVLVLTQWVQSRSKRQKSILTGILGVVVSRNEYDALPVTLCHLMEPF